MRAQSGVRLVVIAAVLSAGATPARADLVYLSSGRVMSVKTHRFEGGRVVLVLRAGGEITCPTSLIASIRPDEVPYPEPPAPEPAEVPAFLLPPYRAFIERVSSDHGVDPRLVTAVIEVESAWDPRAVSRKGAMGLMQLMPATAVEYGVGNPFEPEENISGGVAYLRHLLDRYDQKIELALAAYNAGPGNVEKYGDVPPFRETQNYVRKITESAPAAPPNTIYRWMELVNGRPVARYSNKPPASGAYDIVGRR